MLGFIFGMIVSLALLVLSSMVVYNYLTKVSGLTTSDIIISISLPVLSLISLGVFYVGFKQSFASL